jgi:hypothetical protein
MRQGRESGSVLPALPPHYKRQPLRIDLQERLGYIVQEQ